MTIQARIKRLLSNKYVAVTLLALLWATFVHDLGLPFVMREGWDLREKKKELAAIDQRIELLEIEHDKIMSDPQSLERFARERYFMKRADEEVYRIQH